MPRRALRATAVVALLGAGAALVAVGLPTRTPLPMPLVHVAIADPSAHPPLEAYGALQRARRDDDLAAVRALADTAEGYLAYRVAEVLARDPRLPAAERLAAFERVLALRVDDPLERAARRALHAEIGTVAEAAALLASDPAAATAARERAIAAYREALPNQAALDGLERLIEDPYRRANAFLQAGLATRALEALDGRVAPSIEAPALRAAGRHDEALEAFRRWLDEVPGERSALEGEAWSLFALERWSEADAAFAALGGSTGTYGRGLVAGREGRIDDAVALMLATGQASRMWIATGWLEGRERWSDAIDAYLAIARTGDATYADDAAYRALVVADRIGDAARATIARDLVPPGSYFALRLGATLDVPVVAGVPAGSDGAASATADAADAVDAAPAAPADPAPTVAAAIDLAHALRTVGDDEAARGELIFALRAATERADVLLLAEALQERHDEFRQSQRAAQGLLNAGDRDPRVWRLAYPRAYPDAVDAHGLAFGVEPALVWAIMRQESAFSPVAVSTSNAQGLMQVIPSTWGWLAELQDEAPEDPFDPDANVRYGTYYLRWLLDYFDGDAELVIPSYNRGQGYIRRLYEGEVVAGDKDELLRHIDALETREYLQRVTLNLEVYRALYGIGAEAR
jgi:soluble lytic murein transglycosylase